MSFRSIPCLFVPLILVLIAAPGTAQPPRDDLRELIVLLAPQSNGAPAPESVVAAIREGRIAPGGFSEGGPDRARLAISRRATGRLAETIARDQSSAAALLQRYVVIHYPHANLEGVATALRANRHAAFVENNHYLRFHSATAPAKQAPSDPLLGTGSSGPTGSQWGLHLSRFPEAWTLFGPGRGQVAIIDTGIQTSHEELVAFGVDANGDRYLGPSRLHLSRDLQFGDCNVDELDPLDIRAGHGTHTASTVAAATNGLGIAGGASLASLEVFKVGPNSDPGATVVRVVEALNNAISDGAQVVNMSLGVKQAACSETDERFLCTAIRAALDRDIVLVASAGNDLAPIELPANSSGVISVGGMEWTGVDQNGRPTAELWSEWPNCPLGTDTECGSNFGAEQTLAAAAHSVLAAVYEGRDHNEELGCGDSTLPNEPGYGFCRGTSMSAPHVSALAAYVRSANPLLSWEQVHDLLVSTASHANSWTPGVGFGVPIAVEALAGALGTSAGQVLTNRLTPLFSFFGQSADPSPETRMAETHVYTTAPSTAAALLLEPGDPFQTVGSTVPGYAAFPGANCQVSPCDMVPRASIYLFTTNRPPYPGAPPLVPLIRQRYDPDVFADCDPTVTPTPNRDFTYTTSADEAWHFKTAVVDAQGVGYDLDAIEGWLYESCEGEPGCLPPPGTVRIYRMYHDERDDYAVFPETELDAMLAAGYRSQSGLATVLGYAPAAVDGDGDHVIDAFEAMAGTDPANPDSDCDGLSDGEELLVYDMARGGYSDPLVGPCGVLIFSDSFESGNVILWN